MGDHRRGTGPRIALKQEPLVFGAEPHLTGVNPAAVPGAALTPTMPALLATALEKVQELRAAHHELQQQHAQLRQKYDPDLPDRSRHGAQPDVLRDITVVQRSAGILDRHRSQLERAERAHRHVDLVMKIHATIQRMDTLRGVREDDEPIVRRARPVRVVLTLPPPVTKVSMVDAADDDDNDDAGDGGDAAATNGNKKARKPKRARPAAAAGAATAANALPQMNARDKKVQKAAVVQRVQEQPKFVSWFVNKTYAALGIHNHGWMTLQMDQYRCFNCGARLVDATRFTAVCPSCRRSGTYVLTVTTDMLQPDGTGRDKQQRQRARPGARPNGYRADMRTVNHVQQQFWDRAKELEPDDQLDQWLCWCYAKCGYTTEAMWQTATPVVTGYFLAWIEATKGLPTKRYADQLTQVHRRITGMAPPHMPPRLTHEVHQTTQLLQSGWKAYLNKEDAHGSGGAAGTDANAGTNLPQSTLMTDSIMVLRGYPSLVWWTAGQKRARENANVHGKMAICFRNAQIMRWEEVKAGVNNQYRRIGQLVDSLKAVLPMPAPGRADAARVGAAGQGLKTTAPGEQDEHQRSSAAKRRAVASRSAPDTPVCVKQEQ
jgi:hypothetical protein